jgi:CDP-glycerol glycerophosphotransferase (TagB/SpsB family)
LFHSHTTVVSVGYVVSDASGVAYEFVLQNRPVVFFDVPDLYEAFGTKGVHYWGRECGDIVTDCEGMKAAVVLSLREPNRNEVKRLEWISRLSYAQGDATRRAGEAIRMLAKTPRLRRT